MGNILIKNASVINEGKIVCCDLLIENERIKKIGPSVNSPNATIIDAEGMFAIPGAIDDQVHFREPGLTHKADIYTESKAAVAGGITSYMEMPNTIPNTLTQDLLEEKYKIAASKSLANYSFYMGTSNNNLEELLKTDSRKVCGVKIFMGASTGNMLVDNHKTLEKIFSSCDLLIATHCEDEATIKKNMASMKEKYGEAVPPSAHPLIRSGEACYLSSSFAIELAKKYSSRLHILHISTASELALFDKDTPLQNKRITAEACIHHLWFTDEDYERKGNFIKWNPAIKSESDRKAIRDAVNNNCIDVIATDHAPHTLNEKEQTYLNAPSGGPLVQHAVIAAFEMAEQGVFSFEKAVEKMCHAPAICFNVNERGFLREGYYADIVLLKRKKFTVSKENILYKCGWSPFEGNTFSYSIDKTFVNGSLVYNNGIFDETVKGKRLLFNK